MMIVIKVILKKKKIVLERNLLCAKYSGNYCKLYKQASILHINDNDGDKICINDDCRQIILEYYTNLSNLGTKYNNNYYTQLANREMCFLKSKQCTLRKNIKSI